MDGTEIRLAAADDAAAFAEVDLESLRATYVLRRAHSDDSVRARIRDVLVPSSETWLAVRPDGRMAGFMVLIDEFIDRRYLAPGAPSQGQGGRLVDLAKARRAGGLDLHMFQVSVRARRPCERHAIREVGRGDGSGNEEGQPDIRCALRSGPVV